MKLGLIVVKYICDLSKSIEEIKWNKEPSHKSLPRVTHYTACI